MQAEDTSRKDEPPSAIRRESTMMSNRYLQSAYNGKGKVFYGQEPQSGESTTTECDVNYQLLAVMLLKKPNGELPVAVNHSQLQTMATETEAN